MKMAHGTRCHKMTQWPKIWRMCTPTNNSKLAQMKHVNIYVSTLLRQQGSLLEQNDGFICLRHHSKHSKVWVWYTTSKPHGQSQTNFPIKCHPCSSIWQTHTRRFPVWRISLSVWELNVEKLIDMQKHAAQTGSAVIIGVRGEEVWRRLPHTNGSAHVHEAHKHTHTHSPRPQVCPGPVGNPCLAKELSEPLHSPVSLTRVEKAWAAGEEWGVEWVSLCISGFRRPLLANYGYATAVERVLLQRQMNYDFVLMRENWCGRASSVGVSYLLEMSVVGVPILVIQNDLENFNDWTTLPTMHQDPADSDALQACISNWDGAHFD